MTTTKTSLNLQAGWLNNRLMQQFIQIKKATFAYGMLLQKNVWFFCRASLRAELDIIIPETLRKMHWRGFDAAIAAGVTKHSGKPMATKALRADGSVFYTEMGFALVFNEQGEVVGTMAQARDITERYEKERAERLRLRELEKQTADKA